MPTPVLTVRLPAEHHALFRALAAALKADPSPPGQGLAATLEAVLSGHQDCLPAGQAGRQAADTAQAAPPTLESRVAHLEAGLASQSARLSYAEYSLYDLAVHISWCWQEPQNAYRFKIRRIFKSTDGTPRLSTEVRGDASPAAAVARASRSAVSAKDYREIRIYDAHEKRWLGSLAELVPPDRVPPWSPKASPES